jgi:hypothetical protein
MVQRAVNADVASERAVCSAKPPAYARLWFANWRWFSNGRDENGVARSTRNGGQNSGIDALRTVGCMRVAPPETMEESAWLPKTQLATVVVNEVRRRKPCLRPLRTTRMREEAALLERREASAMV